MPGLITYKGNPVPVVAFYSIQGGVGKTTLARKFAELITRASGERQRRPSVLIVDLDVEAQGLSYRLGQNDLVRSGTIHEAIASRNPNVAIAQNVTANSSLVSAGSEKRGQLYLLPASPPSEYRFFDVIKKIGYEELLQILVDTINRLVEINAISCVVIDCAPGTMPYTAAAATIADSPLLVGRNEDATYRQIDSQARRIMEIYPQFEPARQSVIINAVSVKELFESKAKQFAIADWIPLTGDVIHETEGLRNIESLRMLMFENYVIDLIKKFLIGNEHLIPNAHDVLPDKWTKMLRKINNIENTFRMRLYRNAARVGIPVGIFSIIVGIIAILGSDWDRLSAHSLLVSNIGVSLSAIGIATVLAGILALSRRANIQRLAFEIKEGGPEAIFKKIRSQQSDRKSLEDMLALTETISS